MKLIDSPTLLQLVKSSSSESADKKCVSIFLPTHRSHPESAQDAIRFKNLCNQALKLSGATDVKIDVEKLENQLQQIETDPLFWKNRTEGLGVFYSADDPDEILVLELPRSVPELVVVANSFHIKPLIRILQSADNFHVLALTRESAKLYLGNRDSLEEVKASEFPADASESLPGERKEKELRAESYGGSEGAMFHGHGSKSDEVDKERNKYFRIVADFVERKFSNPSKLPLILVALEEHHAPFQSISKNTHLAAAGVHKDPGSMNTKEIQKAAWDVHSVHLRNRVQRNLERFGNAESNRKGSAVLSDVIRESKNGRVELLLLEESKNLKGHIDWVTGNVETNSSSAPPQGSQGDNAYDDLAEMVLSNGGEVLIVPSGLLDKPSGIAAIYRY